MVRTIPTQSLLSLAALLLIASIAESVRAEPPPPLELTSPPAHDGCLGFDNQKGLESRKALWRTTLSRAFEENQTSFLRWVIGKDAPPDAVVEESRAQMRCLLIALLQQKKAAQKALHFLKVSERSIGQAIHRAKTRKSISGHLERRIVLSNHRSAAGQTGIWKRRGKLSKTHHRRVPGHIRKSCDQTKKAERRACLYRAAIELREEKLMRGTAAPGLSRHHWGTEFDLFAVNSYKFRDRGPLGPAYIWLRDNAHRFGFSQTYLGDQSPGYIAERWHWSYTPISQPLLAILQVHEDAYAQCLEEMWEHLQHRWNRHRKYPVPFFSYVRKHWRQFAYKVGPDWPSEPETNP